MIQRAETVDRKFDPKLELDQLGGHITWLQKEIKGRAAAGVSSPALEKELIKSKLDSEKLSKEIVNGERLQEITVPVRQIHRPKNYHTPEEVDDYLNALFRNEPTGNIRSEILGDRQETIFQPTPVNGQRFNRHTATGTETYGPEGPEEEDKNQQEVIQLPAASRNYRENGDSRRDRGLTQEVDGDSYEPRPVQSRVADGNGNSNNHENGDGIDEQRPERSPQTPLPPQPRGSNRIRQNFRQRVFSNRSLRWAIPILAGEGLLFLTLRNCSLPSSDTSIQPPVGPTGTPREGDGRRSGLPEELEDSISERIAELQPTAVPRLTNVDVSRIESFICKEPLRSVQELIKRAQTDACLRDTLTHIGISVDQLSQENIVRDTYLAIQRSGTRLGLTSDQIREMY